MIADIGRAKKLYEEINQGHDLSLGLNNLRNGFKYHAYEDRLKEVVAELTLNESADVYWAPSPWHACIFGYFLAFYIADETFAPAERKNKDGKSVSFTPNSVLFRGQRCSQWPVLSSLSRICKGKQRKRAENAQKWFSKLLKLALLKAGFPFIDEMALVAAAQHYQIPTPLIDFSLDPAVAVYFANDSSKSCGDGNLGRMFGISYERLKLQKSFHLVLPPPMFERLYTQRGVFAKIEGELEMDSTELYGKVDFVKDDGFRVMRSGKDITDSIMNPHYFIEALSVDCRSYGKNKSKLDFEKALSKYDKGDTKVAYGKFLDSLRHEHLPFWSAQGVQIVEGLGVVNSQKDGILAVQDVFEDLTIDNPMFTAMLVSYVFGTAAGIDESFRAIHQIQTQEANNKGEVTKKYEAPRAFWLNYHMGNQICTAMKDIADKK